MIDEMHRRSNRLAREDPYKYNNYINTKINEPTFKTTDAKQSSSEREKVKDKQSGKYAAISVGTRTTRQRMSSTSPTTTLSSVTASGAFNRPPSAHRNLIEIGSYT
jgi:hypothetical protein